MVIIVVYDYVCIICLLMNVLLIKDNLWGGRVGGRRVLFEYWWELVFKIIDKKGIVGI